MQHALLLAEKAPGQTHRRHQTDHHDFGRRTHGASGKRSGTVRLPATPETIRATFKAVKHCTDPRASAINTFMLDANYYLKAFMDEIAKINGGRVFYTSPEKLGEYILVDYVQHKRKKLARRA